jgi:hypothetical protein
MKSRISILTRRGRSLLLRSMSDVTIGYLSNSSVLSWGNAFFLGVHLLSLLVSPSPNRVAFPRRWSCGTRALASAGRAPRARHCAARCEKSCLKSCVTSGESIDARASCLSRFAAVGELSARLSAVEFAGRSCLVLPSQASEPGLSKIHTMLRSMSVHCTNLAIQNA